MILRLRPMPQGLSPFSWTALIVTWFHSGRIRPASGSWGSLAALPFCWVIHQTFGMIGLALFALILYGLGMMMITRYQSYTTKEDPSEVVIDEVVGMSLMFLAVPIDSISYALSGFIVFRLLDSLKPGPIGWCDRKIKGAHGVLLDDVVAGILSALTLFLIRLV